MRANSNSDGCISHPQTQVHVPDSLAWTTKGLLYQILWGIAQRILQVLKLDRHTTTSGGMLLK